MNDEELTDHFAGLALPLAFDAWKNYYFSRDNDDEEISQSFGLDGSEYQELIAESAYDMAREMVRCKNKYLEINKFIDSKSEIINHQNSIDRFNFTIRTYNVLNNEGIKSIDDLLSKSERDLLRLPNAGLKTINEIKQVLLQHNLKLRIKNERI